MLFSTNKNLFHFTLVHSLFAILCKTELSFFNPIGVMVIKGGFVQAVCWLCFGLR